MAKNIRPARMESIAPTLTPLPIITKGIPHRKPTRIKNREAGRKTFNGLKRTDMFRI